MPDVPTMAEALGLTDFNLPIFYGIAVPAKTPPQVVDTLHAALVKVVADPALRDQFNKMGFELRASESPAEFARFLRHQHEKFKSLKQ